jgi:NAD dependent epimerase/dehydratase family enzyme
MMSWISIDDAAAALMHLLLDESLEGPFNLTAPRPVSNLEFTRTLARVLKRPAVAPVPAFAARAAFGKMADEVLLGGALVLPERLESAGFSFRHPTLEPALRHLLGRS